MKPEVALFILSFRDKPIKICPKSLQYHFGIPHGVGGVRLEGKKCGHTSYIFPNYHCWFFFFVLLFLRLKQSRFLPFIRKNITPKEMTVASKKRVSRYLFIIKQREIDDLLSGNFHTIRHSTHTNLRVTKEISYSSLAYSLVTTNSSEETNKL